MGREDVLKCSSKYTRSCTNAALEKNESIFFFSDGLAVATPSAQPWLRSVLVTPHGTRHPPPAAVKGSGGMKTQMDGSPERLPPQGRQPACSECPPAGRGTRERCGTKERKHNQWWVWPFDADYKNVCVKLWDFELKRKSHDEHDSEWHCCARPFICVIGRQPNESSLQQTAFHVGQWISFTLNHAKAQQTGLY